MKFQKICSEDFPCIYAQLKASFAREERRDFDDAYELLNTENYTIYHVIDDEKRVGFICVWVLEEFAFVEHFAIYSQYRGCGYGTRAIELAKDIFDKLVLEVEPPETETAAKRIAFYKRLGFHINDEPYMQPSYRKSGKRIKLLLMSYPELLQKFDETVRELYTKVYKQAAP